MLGVNFRVSVELLKYVFPSILKLLIKKYSYIMKSKEKMIHCLFAYTVATIMQVIRVINIVIFVHGSIYRYFSSRRCQS